MNHVVKDWFGEKFQELNPKLQQLHSSGGALTGKVDVLYGKSLAGMIGRRIAEKLNIPEEGCHQLAVDIFDSDQGLHWDRCFNDGQKMKSIFMPVGNFGAGYWVESIGPVKMHLAVEIKSGGWHWQCLRYTLFGLSLPDWVFPSVQAYKTIEAGQYRFFVAFRFPLLGELFSYSGLLKLRSK